MIKVALSLRPTHESIATTRRRTTTRHRFSVKASSNNDDDPNDEAKIVAENEQFFNERMESKEDEMELDRRRSLEDVLLSQKEDEKNVWKTKPFWCQPWTIVLTGVGIISLPTILNVEQSEILKLEADGLVKMTFPPIRTGDHTLAIALKTRRRNHFSNIHPINDFVIRNVP